MPRVLSMPADGSCLFWALGYYYDVQGPDLRRMLASYVGAHPDLLISGVRLQDWVRWELNMSLQDYVRALRQGQWGGAVDMAVFNSITGSAISVWVRDGDRYRRIVHFDGDEKPHCHLVYLNASHYGVFTS